MSYILSVSARNLITEYRCRGPAYEIPTRVGSSIRKFLKLLTVRCRHFLTFIIFDYFSDPELKGLILLSSDLCK